MGAVACCTCAPHVHAPKCDHALCHLLGSAASGCRGARLGEYKCGRKDLFNPRTRKVSETLI